MGILVFDVGTSSIRGVLMNEQADILCQFQEKYHPDFHLSIYVTQNPEIWRSVLYDIAKNIQIWCEEHGDKDKIYYHHRRGFEDCFEAPQNIPFCSCL